MASERLSKLQKWILETCFKITVLHDRRGLKPLKICGCYNVDKCPQWAIKERNLYNEIECICKSDNKKIHKDEKCDMYYMYVEDILLNYYSMECSGAKNVIWRVARIKMDENTNKNYATISRTLKNMEDKGLVYRWKFEEYSTRIFLTSKGKEKAMQILNISCNEFYEPPLLTKEECNKREEALERIARKYGLID